MPPPRFVRCNSTSELRSVSVCSTNSAGVAVGTTLAAGSACRGGVAAADDDANGVPVAVAGAGEGAVTPRGRCTDCRATQNSQPMKPRTQRVTAIQAVRSILIAPAYLQTHFRASESPAGTGSNPLPPQG